MVRPSPFFLRHLPSHLASSGPFVPSSQELPTRSVRFRFLFRQRTGLSCAPGDRHARCLCGGGRGPSVLPRHRECASPWRGHRGLPSLNPCGTGPPAPTSAPVPRSRGGSPLTLPPFLVGASTLHGTPSAPRARGGSWTSPPSVLVGTGPSPPPGGGEFLLHPGWGWRGTWWHQSRGVATSDPHRHVAHDSERVSKRTWTTRGDERGRADEEGHPGGARAAQGGRIDASFLHGWRGDDGQAKESQERKGGQEPREHASVQETDHEEELRTGCVQAGEDRARRQLGFAVPLRRRRTTQGMKATAKPPSPLLPSLLRRQTNGEAGATAAAGKGEEELVVFEPFRDGRCNERGWTRAPSRRPSRLPFPRNEPLPLQRMRKRKRRDQRIHAFRVTSSSCSSHSSCTSKTSCAFRFRTCDDGGDADGVPPPGTRHATRGMARAGVRVACRAGEPPGRSSRVPRGRGARRARRETARGGGVAVRRHRKPPRRRGVSRLGEAHEGRIEAGRVRAGGRMACEASHAREGRQLDVHGAETGPTPAADATRRQAWTRARRIVPHAGDARVRQEASSASVQGSGGREPRQSFRVRRRRAHHRRQPQPRLFHRTTGSILAPAKGQAHRRSRGQAPRGRAGPFLSTACGRKPREGAVRHRSAPTTARVQDPIHSHRRRHRHRARNGMGRGNG
eukprot:scaffold752_cov322-Pavlova_lutheri.AAC.21